MLDGVSILPGLDDQPGIAVLDGRAFETGQPDCLSAFHTRGIRSISARSVISLAQAGLAHVAERHRRARRVALLYHSMIRCGRVLDLDWLSHGAGEANRLAFLNHKRGQHL